MGTIATYHVVVPSHIWTRVANTDLEVWHGTGMARRVTVRADGSISLMGAVGWEVRSTRATWYPA
jgi:hypothetical protein